MLSRGQEGQGEAVTDAQGMWVGIRGVVFPGATAAFIAVPRLASSLACCGSRCFCAVATLHLTYLFSDATLEYATATCGDDHLSDQPLTIPCSALNNPGAEGGVQGPDQVVEEDHR